VDPDLLARHPIAIVGNAVNDKVIRAAKGLDHVRVVGWVPSVVPYLHQSRVSIAPLLHGAGTKRKLIQALAAGTPSVSTTIGIESMDVRNGHDVLVADTPEAFAAAITQLLTDSGLWAQLAVSGRHRVTDAHDPATVRAEFEQMIAKVMARPSIGSLVKVPRSPKST
jgi:glycosyltransferase involved in cell wall biosynthesis